MTTATLVYVCTESRGLKFNGIENVIEIPRTTDLVVGYVSEALCKVFNERDCMSFGNVSEQKREELLSGLREQARRKYDGEVNWPYAGSAVYFKVDVSDGSKELLEFLKAYQKWALGDADSINAHGTFSSNVGLCANLDYFMYGKPYEVRDAAAAELKGELPKVVREAAYAGRFPFDESPDAYSLCTISGTMHLNEKRMAWVAATIEKLSQEAS